MTLTLTCDSIEELTPEEIREYWPNLSDDNARTKSEYDARYNCLSFVLGEKKKFWWPLKKQGVEWPKEFPYVNILPNILKMLKEKFGYEKCSSEELEDGYEKIAIYWDKSDYSVKHYAKQTSNKIWKSKLGDFEDIEHDTLDALKGNWYGTSIVFVKRKIRENE